MTIGRRRSSLGRTGCGWPGSRSPRARGGVPRFTFAESAEENQRSIEAIITFVMGLTGEPAPAKYIYRPQGPKKALADGTRVIAKFNCVGCHGFEFAKFTFKAKAEEYPAPLGARVSDFPELVEQPPLVRGKPPAVTD